MEQVFADTSYWVALLNPRDELHNKAQEADRLYSSFCLVTSEMVLAELLNSFSDRGVHLRNAAAKVVAVLRENRNVIIVAQTSEQFEKALAKYQNMADKDWSLTDCASFLIMESKAIRSALTYDHHFVQAGFEASLR